LEQEMAKKDRAIAKISKNHGMAVRVAEACGIVRQAVYQWKKVPVQHVHKVAKVIGMTAEEIRPDIFRKPKNDGLE
jgi:DNA-binding transcriptional regulator YdaS (Cro superfamily)